MRYPQSVKRLRLPISSNGIGGLPAAFRAFLLALVCNSRRAASDGARYVMLIPGRAGSTWGSELLVEHGVRADAEIFSARTANNRLGNGVLCQPDEGLAEVCIAALEQYWAENDTAWRDKSIKKAMMNLGGVRTQSGRIQLEHRLKTAPILARGFKVRPTPGWQTDRMFQYLAKRQVKLICNVRQNLIAEAVSMYRHPLSAEQSRFWNSIVERFGKPEFNNTRQRIPTEVFEKQHSYLIHLNATCIVRLGDAADGLQAEPQFSLHSCTQNISTKAFRQLYHRAAAGATRVYLACARYRLQHDGATHWFEYENLREHPEASTKGILEYLGVPVTPEGERYRMTSRKKVTDGRGGITGMRHSVPNIAEVLDPLMAAISCEGAVSAALPTLKPAVLSEGITYLSPYAMESLMLYGTDHVRPRGPNGSGLTAPFIVVTAPEAGLNPDGFRQHPRVAHFADGIDLDLLPLESTNGPCVATCGTRCRNTIRDDVVAKLTHHALPEHRQSAGFAVSRDHHIWHDTSVMEFLKSHEFRMVCLTRTGLIGAALAAFYRDAVQQPRNVSLDALMEMLLDLHAANNAVIKACWDYERLCQGCTLWLPYHKRDNATARVKDFLGIGDGAEAAADGESMTPPLPPVSSDEGRSPPDFATYQARVPNLPELVMRYLETAVDFTENSKGIVRPYFDAHSVQEILTS